jgi:hypothetical protein
MDHESMPVMAFDSATGQLVATFASISIASRKLFIRSTASICGHLNKGGFKKGVRSYKDGRRYLFAKVK